MSRWKKWGLITLGCAVALALAFSAGRFAAPTEIHTVDVVHTVVKTEVVEKVVEVKAKAQVVYVDRVITKEGEVRERVITKTVERETKTADTETKEATDSTAKAESITKNDAPRLTVMLLAGVDLQPAWQPIPGAGPVAVGLAVNYRIAGPIVVGLFGLHTGVVGVGVGGQF